MNGSIARPGVLGGGRSSSPSWAEARGQRVRLGGKTLYNFMCGFSIID